MTITETRDKKQRLHILFERTTPGQINDFPLEEKKDGERKTK